MVSREPTYSSDIQKLSYGQQLQQEKTNEMKRCLSLPRISNESEVMFCPNEIRTQQLNEILGKTNNILSSHNSIKQTSIKNYFQIQKKTYFSNGTKNTSNKENINLLGKTSSENMSSQTLQPTNCTDLFKYLANLRGNNAFYEQQTYSSEEKRRKILIQINRTLEEMQLSKSIVNRDRDWDNCVFINNR